MVSSFTITPLHVKSIIDEIYKKDIQKNNRIKNRKLFDTIRTYFINNFGSPMSVGRLCDYLERTTKETVRKETVYRYISILEDAKIISRCRRFDLKSKRSGYCSEVSQNHDSCHSRLTGKGQVLFCV